MSDSTKVKVVDCFPFFDEFTILDVRFRELYDLVDYFVVIESPETFAGHQKPLYLTECLWERYPLYADKVRIIVAPIYVNSTDVWEREYFQKNHICRENLAHLGLSDNDLVFIGDADEIPRRSVVQNLIENGYPLEGGALEYKTYYYKFNILTTEMCYRSKYVSYGCMTNFKNHRYSMQSYISNAGWHFSYIKSPEKIKEKIASFSHQEFNIPEINNLDNIEDKIKSVQDLFNRPEVQMSVVDIDDSFPEYVKENLDRLSEWVHQDDNQRSIEFRNAFDKAGSDKSAAHSYEHAYASVLPKQVGNLLEIGIFEGASARAWQTLFPSANIYCLDHKEDFLINEGTIRSFLVDQSSVESLTGFRSMLLGTEFDVMIDDGSHVFEYSKLSFQELFPLMAEQGVYAVEDISKNGNGWQQTVSDWDRFLSGKYGVNYRFIDTKPGVDDDSVVLVITKKQGNEIIF